MVFDFDPGPGTDITNCCALALRVREILASVGLQGWCKTSGSKGLQLYVPLNTAGVTHDATAHFARAVGAVLERETPDEVTTTMAKVERPGKIFVDWSQNAFHKTTIAPYSLRARPEPTVSTPVTWDEVAAVRRRLGRAAVRSGRRARPHRRPRRPLRTGADARATAAPAVHRITTPPPRRPRLRSAR